MGGVEGVEDEGEIEEEGEGEGEVGEEAEVEGVEEGGEDVTRRRTVEWWSASSKSSNRSDRETFTAFHSYHITAGQPT